MDENLKNLGHSKLLFLILFTIHIILFLNFKLLNCLILIQFISYLVKSVKYNDGLQKVSALDHWMMTG